MAPEILSNKTFSGRDVDLFALGVILFNMFTGRKPFEMAANKLGSPNLEKIEPNLAAIVAYNDPNYQ
jgi:serine/threonine protein kinase